MHVILCLEYDGTFNFDDTHIQLWKSLVSRLVLHTTEKHFDLLVRKPSTKGGLSSLKQVGCPITFPIP